MKRASGKKSWLASTGWPGRALPRTLIALVVLTVLRVAAGSRFGTGPLWDLVFVATMLLVALVFWRLVTRKLLWRVRTRLLITYLLLGLAPIVLFGLLILTAAYVFAGQYATNSALRSLEIAADQVRNESGALAVLSMMNAVPASTPVFNRQELPPAAVAEVALATRVGNQWEDFRRSGKTPEHDAGNGVSPHSVFAGRTSPDWLQAGFQGLVDLDGRLYLCSETEVSQGGRSGLVLASLPVGPPMITRMASGLGTIMLLPGGLGSGPDPSARDEIARQAKEKTGPQLADEVDHTDSGTFHVLSGGMLPAARNLADLRVVFSAPLTVRNWNTGTDESGLVFVTSRPTLLYARLFSTSVQVGQFVRIALLIALGTVLFIELLAVLMAIGLSRTITRSVAALYRGTSEIDGGNLAYRIPGSGHDQLAELITSFNTMSGSMQELVIQQREKERLESELSIALDVQRNLFPVSPFHHCGLEVFAVCLPARIVSGDYYDYFGGEGQLCIALGDISGKGMSAALLMASLHAAVRSLGLSVEVSAQGGEPSSAHLFTLLNRQLLQSTQPERYATLFLTFYDEKRRTLTYTNGGHLAPWLFTADGSHRALDRGGPVVGLLSGMEYQETTIACQKGDLLVAYSDGLTEAESEEGEFGEARLHSFIFANRHLPLSDLAARTLAQVRTWVGDREQSDDRTMLLARID